MIITLQSYYEMTKPKVVLLLLLTALVGMCLASDNWISWKTLLAGLTGIGFLSSAAAVINHVVDRRIDSQMARTFNRPLPKGKVSLLNAVIFAWFLGTISMGVLAFLVNPLTAGLTALSLIGYGFIYSMYLKRATPQNIVIGGAAGAAPPVLGWTAVTGTLDPNSLLLFLIIFAWTPPHFWALAIYRREEYAKVNIPMLPVTHGVEFTRLHILLYTIVLFIVTLLPYLVGMSGLFYLIGAVLLCGGFLYYAIRMQFDHRDRLAMQTFSFSIVYLMLMFAFLLIDHYIPLLASVL